MDAVAIGRHAAPDRAASRRPRLDPDWPKV